MFRQAAERIALIFPPYRRLVEQRNVAWQELKGLRDEFAAWQTALRSFLLLVGETETVLPSAAELESVLAAVREREVDRCRKAATILLNDAVLQRDQARHERDDARAMMAQLSADNTALTREITTLRRKKLAPLFHAADGERH